MSESYFTTGAVQPQIASARGRTYEFPRAFEEECSEVIAGVHVDHVEAQLDHVCCGNEAERHHGVLHAAAGAKAITRGARCVVPWYIEGAHRRCRIAEALIAFEVLREAGLTAASLDDQFCDRDLYFFLFAGLESVDAAAHRRES